MGTIRHYIQTEDFSTEEYMQIIKRAEEFEKNPESAYHLCEGKVMATMFFKESTRTATLMQSAMQRMGGGWIGIQGTAGTYIASGEEDEEDTLRSVAPYSDIMVIRHNYLDLNTFAHDFPIPMMNGMVGGDEHTISGLMYMYTIYKLFGRLDGLKLGLYGQNKNCRPHKTLSKLLGMFGAQVIEDPVVDALGLPEHIVQFVRDRGGSYERRPLHEFIGEVDLLMIADGMPSSKEDPALMEEYNQKWKTMEPEDFKALKEGAYFAYMMPRAMTDGRITVSKAVDHDPRMIEHRMMGDAVWPMMASIRFLLEKVGK